MRLDLRSLLTLGLLAAPLLLSTAGTADARTRVRKVDTNRYKCTFSDGSTTHTTAGSKEQARSNCNALAGASRTVASVDDEGPADQATPMKEEKSKVAP
jgi:hypothetical protein